MPDDFVNIEAAKEGGISWLELEELPVWRRETLLAKVSAEREAEKFLCERARRESESKRRK